jgi:DNA-directed RNA polymerase sigma subunit (sigma70/sigma32)
MKANPTTKDRDQLIFDRHNSGNTLRQIANELNISPERVRQIIRRATLKQTQGKESQKLLKQIRKADDIDRLLES